jgi:hypothetical protein
MSIENLSGKKVTQTYYVLVCSRAPSEPFLACSDWSKDSPSSFTSYICYGKVDVDYTIPSADPVKKAVESVESQITTLRAEFQHNLELLQEKKQQLLAIGYDNPADDFVSDTIDDKE